MYDEGISLPFLQQQGFEHLTSNESAFHCTPSSHQIFLRQMRIFVEENEIFIDMENLSDVNNMFENMNDDLFNELNFVTECLYNNYNSTHSR